MFRISLAALAKKAVTPQMGHPVREYSGTDYPPNCRQFSQLFLTVYPFTVPACVSGFTGLVSTTLKRIKSDYDTLPVRERSAKRIQAKLLL